jgi:hypothetical protein
MYELVSILGLYILTILSDDRPQLCSNYFIVYELRLRQSPKGLHLTQRAVTDMR